MTQTVLLVEDNTDTRMIYRTILEHFAYHVIESVDGEMGIPLAKQHRPDLILMDISIPKIDGYTATGILKADPATAHIPIIARTAHAHAGEEQRAREAGCDSYLSKPVEPRRVIEEVQAHLTRASTENASGRNAASDSDVAAAS